MSSRDPASLHARAERLAALEADDLAHRADLSRWAAQLADHRAVFPTHDLAARGGNSYCRHCLRYVTDAATPRTSPGIKTPRFSDNIFYGASIALALVIAGVLLLLANLTVT